MNWNKRIILGIGLSCMGICVAALLAELGLRILYPQRTASLEFSYDPERGAIAVPNQCGSTHWPGIYTYRRCNNSLGLRGAKEYSLAKDKPRILMLGDSFTYGVGVNDDETFSARTQSLFDASSTSVEIINAGNGGTGTDYALKFFQVAGAKFHPDITALFFFWNDYHDNSRKAFFEKNAHGELTPKPLQDSLAAKKSFLNNSIYRWLIANSHLANLLKSSLVEIFVRHYSSSNDLYVNSNPWAFTPDSQEITKTYLLALRNETEKNGSKLVVFYIPQIDQAAAYIKDGVVSAEETFLATFLKENEIPFASASPVLKASDISVDELYYKTEGHWRASAHARFAEFLQPYFSLLLSTSTHGQPSPVYP